MINEVYYIRGKIHRNVSIKSLIKTLDISKDYFSVIWKTLIFGTFFFFYFLYHYFQANEVYCIVSLTQSEPFHYWRPFIWYSLYTTSFNSNSPAYQKFDQCPASVLVLVFLGCCPQFLNQFQVWVKLTLWDFLKCETLVQEILVRLVFFKLCCVPLS